MGIKIICDSTAYIPKELLEKYDIAVVSLNIIMENQSFREVDIDTDIFYKKLKASKEFPTSAQPLISEMYEAFEKVISKGDELVGVFMSSDMSGTYSSAHLVKAMILEKYTFAVIEIVDSRSNCMQLGYVTLAAAEAARCGESIPGVILAAQNVIEKSRFLFVPDTLEYLKKGGRMGGAAALIGMLLQIRPVLTVIDGKTSVLDKVRTKKKAVDKIIDTLLEDAKNKGIEKVMVHTIYCEEEGAAVAERIEKLLDMKIEIYPIGPVIGLHTGPGAIGVVYYTKK